MLKNKTKIQSNENLLNLLEAAKNGKDDIVQSCIEAGADIEAKDDNGRTALHLAAYKHHTSTIKLLLDLGANINATDSKNRIALNYVTTDGSYNHDIFLLLIQRGSNITANVLPILPAYPRIELLYENLVLARRDITHLKKKTIQLEERTVKQDTIIQELQKEVKMLRAQMQELTELTKQKTITSKDNDDSSADKKSYSPSFNFQNNN